MRKALCFLEGLSVGYETVLLQQHVDTDLIKGVVLIVGFAIIMITLVDSIPDLAPIRRTSRDRRRATRLLLIRE